MKTVDEKLDDAVHAAMEQLGLSVAEYPELADQLNGLIYMAAQGYIADDTEED